MDLVLGGDGTVERDVEIWLPPGETTRLVALTTDAPVSAPPRRRRPPRWVHHGSSISHGAGAASALGAWPMVAARVAGLDLVNLGFSGNAVLDPFVARAIRDQPADVITLKLGINVVNHDAIHLRAFAPAVHGFLDTIRDGHPTTPLVVVSPLLCPLVETTPGPDVARPGRPVGVPHHRPPVRGRRRQADPDGHPVRAARGASTPARDSALTYVDGRHVPTALGRPGAPALRDRRCPMPPTSLRPGTARRAHRRRSADRGPANAARRAADPLHRE